MAAEPRLEPVDVVPALAVSERDAALVDSAAAGAAFEAVRRVELLLDHWGTHHPGVLRSGGLAVRDLKAAAVHLHVDEATAAFLIETAATAGLLAARADADGDPVWVPTDAFDTWTDQPPAARWVTIARAWLESPRMPARIGTKDPAGKTWNALSPELASASLVETRRATLSALIGLPVGMSLAAGTGLPSLVEHVAWHRPRRPRSRTDHVVWTVTEAALLGLTGLDAASSFARALVAGRDAAPKLAPLLPEAVDHVLIQADLTAVAPGPLEAALARSLQLVADVESRGGATVYRFTRDSVRRALDVGWTSAELHEFISSVSRTPVPQPLTYLVDDTVRTFGTVRVGQAEAFLRADDESALTELLHHPKAATLGLRRLAPTVLISTLPIDVLLPRLRELGASPVVEAADGTVQVTRPDVLRARSPRARLAPSAGARDAARVSSVLTAIRAGERATTSRPTAAATPLTPSGSLAALREAIDAGATVVIGYVDNHGVSSDRVVDPVAIEGGALTAHDHRADDVRSFAVHRITTVRELDVTGLPPQLVEGDQPTAEPHEGAGPRRCGPPAPDATRQAHRSPSASTTSSARSREAAGPAEGRSCHATRKGMASPRALIEPPVIDDGADLV